MSIMSYTVKKGDTLTKIARAHGTTVEKFLQANPEITNPNRIKEGQILILPATVGMPPTDGMTYVVKRGDTLFKIAQKHYGKGLASYDTLIAGIAKANKVPNPDKIKEGQVLKIPKVSI